MPRATIASRLQAGLELEAFLAVHGEVLAEGMGIRVGDGPETGTGLLSLLEGLRKTIVAARQELEARDRELRDRQLEARPKRKARDEAVTALRARLMRLRRYFSSHMDADGIRHFLGFEGRTAEDPRQLLQQGRQVQQSLEQPNLLLFRHKPVDQMDFPILASGLGRKCEALEKAIDDAVRAAKGEEAGILARRRAARAFDEIYRPACRWLEALCALAGAPALASSIRPRRRRGGRKKKGHGESPLANLLQESPVEPPASEGTADPLPPLSEVLPFPRTSTS